MIQEQYADVELSRAAAEEEDFYFVNKDCRRNTALYIGVYPEVYYCEGWAIKGTVGIPMEHAWAETPDGKLVELTPIWVEDAATNRYYAAVKFSLAVLLKHLGKMLWPLYRKEFEAAYVAAQLASFGKENAETVMSWFPDHFPDGKYQEEVVTRILD